MIRDTVNKFVDNEFKPVVGEHFEAGLSNGISAHHRRHGFTGQHLDGYGCAGASAMAYGIACRELEAGDSGLEVCVRPGSLHVPYLEIRVRGTKRGMAAEDGRGEVIGCFGLTELTTARSFIDGNTS